MILIQIQNRKRVSAVAESDSAFVLLLLFETNNVCIAYGQMKLENGQFLVLAQKLFVLIEFNLVFP